MDITKINSQADLDRALEFMTPSEVKRAESRLAKMANKPTLVEVNVDTIVGTGVNYKGEEFLKGIFTSVKDGRNGKFLSTWFRWDAKHMTLLPTHSLKDVALMLVAHVEAMEAQGYQFPEAKTEA